MSKNLHFRAFEVHFCQKSSFWSFWCSFLYESFHLKSFWGSFLSVKLHFGAFYGHSYKKKAFQVHFCQKVFSLELLMFIPFKTLHFGAFDAHFCSIELNISRIRSSSLFTDPRTDSNIMTTLKRPRVNRQLSCFSSEWKITRYCHSWQIVLQNLGKH